MSSDTLTFLGWDANFTDGAAIASVKERRSHTDILIRNLSSSFSNEQLKAEVARFGSSASIMRDSRKKRARIRFLDAAAAYAALVELDCKRLGMSRVETELDRSKDTEWIENGILLVYDTCQTSAEVTFSNEAQATDALRLNRSTFHGRRIRITRDDPLHLTVEDLPAIFDEDDLLTFLSADTAQITRDYGEDMDTSTLLQALIREQPGCASLHLKQLLTNLGLGAGWIKVYNDDRASEISTEVRGLRPIFLSGNTVTAHKAQAFVWKLTPRHYKVIQSQLLEDVELEDAYLHFNTDSPDEVEVRVVSADLRRLRAAKVAVDAVIRGELWMENGLTMWDRHWVLDEGRKFIEEVNEISAAHVHANFLERTITISGQEEAKECAKVMLQGRLDELDRSQHRIKLPKELMEYFLEHGLPRLMDRLTHFESTIGRKADVEFRGSDLARQELNVVLDQCSSEIKIRSEPHRPICPVCTSEVVDPLHLECGHAYCTECLVHLITSAMDFPIQCIASGCNRAPSLRILQRVVTPSQYRQVLSIAFRSYLRGNDQLHACPTTDCPQLWSDTSPASQCSTCLVRICSSCKTEAHLGMTCDEYQRSRLLHQSERLLATWRASRGGSVKACPSCGTIIERVEGCPHIHCVHCNAHWCWECARTMPRAELVYAHIRRRHAFAAARWLAPMNMG